MKRISIIMVIGVALALLSACGGDIPVLPSDAVPDAGALAASPTPTSTPEASDISPGQTDDIQDNGDQQVPPEPSATPTVRPGLEATDPESVDLASGKPTLLEFFAFW